MAQIFNTNPASFILRDQMDPGAEGLLNLAAAVYGEAGAAKNRTAQLELARLLAGQKTAQAAQSDAPPSLFDRDRIPQSDIARLTTQQMRDEDPASPTFGQMIDVPMAPEAAAQARIRGGVHPGRAVPITAAEADGLFTTDPSFQALNRPQVDLGLDDPPRLFAEPESADFVGATQAPQGWPSSAEAEQAVGRPPAPGGQGTIRPEAPALSLLAVEREVQGMNGLFDPAELQAFTATLRQLVANGQVDEARRRLAVARERAQALAAQRDAQRESALTPLFGEGAVPARESAFRPPANPLGGFLPGMAAIGGLR